MAKNLPERRSGVRWTDPRIAAVLALVAGMAIVLFYPGNGVEAQSAPRYKFDPE